MSISYNKWKGIAHSSSFSCNLSFFIFSSCSFFNSLILSLSSSWCFINLAKNNYYSQIKILIFAWIIKRTDNIFNAIKIWNIAHCLVSNLFISDLPWSFEKVIIPIFYVFSRIPRYVEGSCNSFWLRSIKKWIAFYWSPARL